MERGGEEGELVLGGGEFEGDRGEGGLEGGNLELFLLEGGLEEGELLGDGGFGVLLELSLGEGFC